MIYRKKTLTFALVAVIVVFVGVDIWGVSATNSLAAKIEAVSLFEERIGRLEEMAH